MGQDLKAVRESKGKLDLDTMQKGFVALENERDALQKRYDAKAKEVEILNS